MPDHWDGDLIKGAPQWVSHPHAGGEDNTAGYLSKMDGTNATSAPKGFTKKLQHVPTLLRKTVTGDPGKEMAQDEPLA